jgi:hypothetical protein
MNESEEEEHSMGGWEGGRIGQVNSDVLSGFHSSLKVTQHSCHQQYTLGSGA